MLTAVLPSVAELIASGQLRARYQPIVELERQTPVAYEALARGPARSPLETPAALFGEAERTGLVAELDLACREAALEGALRAGLAPPHLLFVNAEPSTLGRGGLFGGRAERRLGDLGVVVEFTERALTARPAEVLSAVRWLRERGCGIALDDVGADERSLALMPFLAPDVIKLDMRIVHERQLSVGSARVVNAVGAEAERSGSVVLAEGIETEEHLHRARSMGAVLGQGWLFGRPGPLPATTEQPARKHVELRPAADSSASSPFALIADARDLRRGDKRLLLALSRQLEAEAFGLGGEVVIMAAFQDAAFFTAQTRERYERLADRAALVGALGGGMSAEPAPGVRGASFEPNDPLRGEWDVIVVSPHFAGAFVARDLGDQGADLERRFDFFLTYDRDLVTRAARPLMSRIVPVD